MTKYNTTKRKPLPDNIILEQPNPLPEGSCKILLSRGLFAIVDEEDYERLSKYNWCANVNHRTVYADRADFTDGKKATVKMHREILGLKRGDKRVVDHINHNGVDNRKCNLQIITHAENIKNQSPRQEKPDSIYTGVVYRVSEAKKWLARIHVNGRYKKIGYFNNEMDAAKAYDEEAKRIFGYNADLNFYSSEKP
jgi:hypothetical protein